MRTALPGFDTPTRTVWRGLREIEIYDGDRHCSRCTFGTVARLGPFIQDALFYHGGYGASERVMVDVCYACGHAKRAVVATVRPLRRTQTPALPIR